MRKRRGVRVSEEARGRHEDIKKDSREIEGRRSSNPVGEGEIRLAVWCCHSEEIFSPGLCKILQHAIDFLLIESSRSHC